ncbi:hypothetical protein DRW41_08855 [Neobacillus piezotolerans]|uniref:Uncharacterized protein n=1 Tax=Neobacillus piezotolerans TaxID=2259171 RepID=A0A3D8GUL5_9BACI|nr:hypothetical protein [Neobacillus piezotolerans]RDU37909.1 hypothetical protein DRW41_08855 [Neobacillus piezotolerans]
MRKILMLIGLLLIVGSAWPMFQMAREEVINSKITKQYKIDFVNYEQGFPRPIDTQEIEVNGRSIKIVEELTGKKAPLTHWDLEEGVPAGDIVKLHLLVDGNEVTNADEIWLSNRDKGGRYYSWLEVLKVNDKTAIVQRLTDDDAPMDDRRWKIIWIDDKITEERVSYLTRAENPLGVRLINASGTSQMAMGYQSDILQMYPTLFFPILYPYVTTLLGILLCIIAFFIRKKAVE